MAAILALLVLQAAAAESPDQDLAKARASRQPVCLLFVDDGAASRSLLKSLDQNDDLRKIGGHFEIVTTKRPKPEFLLDLPSPVVAVAEPAWIPKAANPDRNSLGAACRGIFSLAGEFAPGDRQIVELIKTSGRGCHQKIGPMDLKSSVPVVAGWISQKHELKRWPLVLDASIPEVTRVEWEGESDHTFESILQACTLQNKLIMYPSGGTIVLAAKPPRADLDLVALRVFLEKYDETEELPGDVQNHLQKALDALSSDDLNVRDVASRTIKDAGVKARRWIRKALSASSDAEVRSRLASLLKPVPP